MQKVRRLLVAAILFVTATQVPATVHAAPPNPTPQAPTTTHGGEDYTIWLFIALGLGAVAFGIGGATVAKRNR